MTALMKKAFEAASQLSEAEQDWIAVAILAEVTDDVTAWEEKFAATQTQLGKLAERALLEHAQGRTKPIDPQSL